MRPLRVCLIGTESTGKTTLARALAGALAARGGPLGATCWVPEHGRQYTIDKLEAARRHDPTATMGDLAWTTEDFVAIARGQVADEASAASRTGPVLVADTDALATAVWHERYLGARAPEVEALAAAHLHDLYLLTHHDDVPFEPDAIRDGEHLRVWMTDRFREVVRATGRPLVELRGDRDGRLAQALAAVEAALLAKA